MAYTTTTKQWFTTTAPTLVARAPAAIASGVGGAVLFEIEGRDGGVWVVDFGARTVRAARDIAGNTPQPKVIVRAGERDFMALVEGRMSADDGVLTRRLSVAGDVAAIAQLMDVLTPARGELA